MSRGYLPDTKLNISVEAERDSQAPTSNVQRGQVYKGPKEVGTSPPQRWLMACMEPCKVNGSRLARLTLHDVLLIRICWNLAQKDFVYNSGFKVMPHSVR